jgi:hypothetical protein
MGMQIVPPGDHVCVQVGDRVGHALSSTPAILPRAREKSDCLRLVIARAGGRSSKCRRFY